MSQTNYWTGKNVLITGINGFIGGNLAMACLRKGANITGIIRNIKKNTILFYGGMADKVNIIQGDITDKDLMRRIIVEEQINCCFHLAAQVEVGVARDYPYLTWETNVRGTYALLEAVRENREKVQAVITASSDKAYGSYDRDKLPYVEDYPLIPIYPYDVSKACADMISRSYASDLYDLPIIITRFCNIYGPGQLNFSALIPDAIRSALGYSTFIPRGNGLHIRDYIYIDDVVDLYMLFAERLSADSKLKGEIFNVGTNQPMTVKDIVKKIYGMLGKDILYAEVEKLWADRQTVGEISSQYMSYDKLNRYFGWKPQIDFDTGLYKTIEWFKKYFLMRYGN
ncbi:MAG: GDP-mannose 4,6-dehydratase [Nitrospirae bacterium]|nr:GDP-mannose 4,6-dehydratase [Nitrospirota bacterium]MCL5976710.1 GDP-mannose 4,6-dehydratase [Nitrospirota bacterium]